MRKLLLSFALIAGLFLPIGAIHAQDTGPVTATCKDGTAFTGAKCSGGLSGSWRRAVVGCSIDGDQPCLHTSLAHGLDGPAHRSQPQWRHR
jgi:hypothetical protein